MAAPFLATDHVISDYCQLFVNRRAFTVQSFSRDPESGRCNYFRPRGNVSLSTEVLRRHLQGEITIALYAINPLTQRCKWMAIDADYPDALRDLLKLQWGLQQGGVEAALEKSRRGGHLWIFAQQPLLARACRSYIHALAAQSTKEDTEEELNRFLPSEPPKKESHEVTSTPYRHPSSRYVMRSPFAILQHLAYKGRRVGRNYVTRCPACASRGKDRHGDNLSVLIADPRKYKCWAGCTKEEIRSALGCPIPEFPSFVLRSSAETKTNPL